MKKIVYALIALASLVVLGILGMGSSAKTVIANAKDVNNGYNYYPKTTFDHIDIESEASFTYYVDGEPVKVDINFYNDKTNLSKINIYKKNKDGTLTEIQVKGKWQNQSGSTDKEYRISGTFDRYYDSTAKDKEEVVYVVKFTLSVTINGVSQDLVYTEDYSYSSSNNVCPGDSTNKGIDVEITGTKLEEFFSSSVKIIKNVENAEDATFTFNVSAVNSSVNFNKDVQITTSNKTGFITIGGLKAGEKYRISEINIPKGYELVGEQPIEITAEKNKTIEVTFTNRSETVDVSGTKTWKDNDNQDGIRPTEITVKLLKNGEEYKSVNVTAANNWVYSFNDLLKYEDGEEIVYTVKEVSVAGYETKVDGYNITNTHAPEKVSVSGTKTWEDNDNQDGIRPTEITVKLLKNGKEFKEIKVNAENGWKYSFTDLDKYENGKEIAYTIEEVSVAGYETKVDGNNITNTHTPEKTSVSGTKTWEDNDNQDGIRPTEITVKLLKNGKEFKEIKVNAENGWKYSFTDLDKYENGKEIAYTIEEVSVAGYITKVDGNNITNTHTPEKTSVSGTKTWKDNDNQDGIRPTEITVKLLKNGEEFKEVKVNAQNGWKYSFTDLDKYENGKEIAYTIEEVSVAGYITKVDGNNITNTHTPEKTSVSGTKTWKDNDNQDGIRPTEITVKLLKNGKEFKEIKVNAENGWKYSFTDLDKYENGKEIEYTIKEEKVDGYSTLIDGYNITNVHETEKTIVSGTKTWNDNNNQDGIRPESITVNLLKNGVGFKSIEVTKENNWSYEFENLAMYENGEKITYTITEDAVAGYETEIDDYNITNTHIPEVTIIKGQKIWNDNNDQDGIRPDSITIRLLANNQEVSSAVITAGENNDWTYAFTNFPKYNNGELINYTVVEDEVDGYTTTYEEIEGENIIINTHLIEKTYINGTKTWDDNNNQDGKRPDSITVRLYADGEEFDSCEVTADDNWTYSFNDLDKFKDGELISYTITEDAIENYSTEINGYDITNVHVPDKVSVSGTKTWTDNDNQDGIRPEYIIVNLLKNGEVFKNVKVTEENNWNYSFDDLDKYENGTEIKYTLTEETVDGYETVIDGYDITNTHNPEKITFKATKVWIDNDNQDGIRQEEINVKLYKNGELFKEVKITEEDNWTYEFKDLDRYEDGKEIVYTIEEDVVIGYEVEINYDDIDENNIVSATITNIHTPEQTTIEINKTWSDYNNEKETRPDNINVDLYANGEYLKTIVITNQQDWKYIITGLDKYANGEEITYTIVEEKVAGYTTTYDGFNITNTLEIGKGGDAIVEVLPPQTGVNGNDSNLLFSIFGSFMLSLFLMLRKFI